MGSNHVQGASIDAPWEFKPHDQLSLDDPPWIIRGMWYDGYDGDFVVVVFRWSDGRRGWNGRIARWIESEHARAHFERFSKLRRLGYWELVEGVYLFRRHELLKQSGPKFSEFTGENELPDGRW